jgi:hypothetical protein
MSAAFESVLLSVWQQTLVDKKKAVEIDGETYSVRQTAKSKLKQVDFRFEGRELRGLEQNPDAKSRWAKLAREGGPVMQFLEPESISPSSRTGKFRFISSIPAMLHGL